MKKVRKSFILLLLPAFCFAHGEEAIYVMLAEFLAILLIMIGIFSLNIYWKKKLVLISILFISYFLSFFLVSGIPFRNHEIVVIICQFIFIIASISLVYYKFLKGK